MLPEFYFRFLFLSCLLFSMAVIRFFFCFSAFFLTLCSKSLSDASFFCIFLRATFLMFFTDFIGYFYVFNGIFTDGASFVSVKSGICLTCSSCILIKLMSRGSFVWADRRLALWSSRSMPFDSWEPRRFTPALVAK